MASPLRPTGFLGHALGTLGHGALNLLTSRSVVIVSTTCAVIYAGVWIAALLQSNGLINANLPVPVSDQVVLQRGGGEMRQSAVDERDKEQRERGLAQSQTAPPGTAGPGSPSALTLEIQTGPPASLWVIDERGGEIGTNPDTGLVRLQIRNASYSGRGTDPQLVSIPDASGTYRIQLLGTANGSFSIRVRVFPGDDLNQAVQYTGTGEIFTDTLLETGAQVSLEADGKPQLLVTPVHVLVVGAAPPAPAAAEAPPVVVQDVGAADIAGTVPPPATPQVILGAPVVPPAPRPGAPPPPTRSFLPARTSAVYVPPALPSSEPAAPDSSLPSPAVAPPSAPAAPFTAVNPPSAPAPSAATAAPTSVPSSGTTAPAPQDTSAASAPQSGVAPLTGVPVRPSGGGGGGGHSSLPAMALPVPVLPTASSGGLEG